MATEPLIELGSNYELDEDSNGNFVIRDSGGNAILTYDDANTRWEVAQNMVPATDGAEQLGTPGTAFAKLVANGIGNDGSDVSVDDTLDLQSSQEIANAAAISTDTSVTVSSDDTIAYGRDHGATVQGDNVVVGVGARAREDVNQTVSGNDPRKVAVGYEAAKNDEQFGVTAAGYLAARDNTGDRVTTVGYRSAQNNTGKRVTTAGYKAAQNNTRNRVTAAGYRSAQNNMGFGVTAAGYSAARGNTGFGVTTVGYRSARDNTGTLVTTVGYQAAQDNTGDRVTAVGYQAARGDGLADPATMGDDNIGIGDSAIRNNQASGLIAIGQDAGINAQTDNQLIITQQDGTRRMVMDLTTGDLKITGSLTENASL
jgi:hypothetical protein